MNPSQQIFVVFFAIFWGTVANSWPRWRAFHWTFVFRSFRILARVILSTIVLNVTPVAFFAWVLRQLSSQPPELSTAAVLRGIVPVFGIFGIYRLWIAIVELKPTWFYYTRAELNEHPKLKATTEPGLDDAVIRLDHDQWFVNALFGLAYVCLGFVA